MPANNANNQNNNNQKMYVFRLHKKGAPNLINNGWGVSELIGSQAIETIEDNGNKIHDKITSIPSPFARLALARQAFEYVVAQYQAKGKAGLEENTVYHRIVSACLDVAQIFYHYDEYSDKFRIHAWSLKDIGDTSAIADKSHRQLMETLKLYADMDSKLPNYTFYLLEYIGQNTASFGNPIVGATSPYTGFVAATEKMPDLKFIKFKDYYGNIDTPLDDYSRPLHQRSKDFIRYMQWLTLQPKFQDYFTDENSCIKVYIEQCKNSVDSDFKEELQSMTEKTTPEEISIAPFEDKSAEIFQGFPAYKLSRPPHLANFLENCLMRTDISMEKLPNQENRDFFLLGEGELSKYLLPIKKEYFRYYTAQDLKNQLKASIDRYGIVSVNLTLPDGVVYEKKYQLKKGRPGVGDNALIIEIGAAGTVIFPHVKYDARAQADYRIAMLCGNTPNGSEKNEYAKDMALSFYCRADNKTNVLSQVSSENTDNKNFDNEDTCISPFKISVVKENFDFMQISIKHKDYKNPLSNAIIPLFGKYIGGTGNRKFFFSVDFGTTNTHVDYSWTDDGSSYAEVKSFDIEDSAVQFSRCKGIYEHISARLASDNAFMPYPGTCGTNKDSKFSFPIRTAISCPDNINWQFQTLTPFFDSTIPFLYEKAAQPKYNEKPSTGLKWDSTDEGIKKTEAFLSSLAYIIRNKVLIGGGNLNDTQLVWFYPTSMDISSVEKISEIWKRIYSLYFGEGDNIKHMPEAVAPWINIDQKAGRCVNIDIGGGTTDFLFGEDNKVQFISSARFASNSLFGRGLIDDGAAFNPKNGIVSKFKDQAGNAIRANKEELKYIPYDEVEKSSPEDLASFFFQLKDHECLRNKPTLREKLDFPKWIRENQKCNKIALVFYFAIIYYAAKLLKNQGCKEPRFIYFSGNGSKIFNMFLEKKHRNSVLMEMTKKLIMAVFGKEEYDKNGIDILMHADGRPKEATAAGGIRALTSSKRAYDECMEDDFARRNSVIWTGADESEVQSVLKLSERIDNIKEKRKNLHELVENTISDFCEKCKIAVKDSDTETLGLGRNFGPEYFDMEVFSRDIEVYVRTGDNKYSQEDDKTIYSSLFFYPIAGILHALAEEV